MTYENKPWMSLDQEMHKISIPSRSQSKSDRKPNEFHLLQAQLMEIRPEEEGIGAG